jgi:hypothetical protein
MKILKRVFFQVVKKGLVRIHQGHCNPWLGLVNNTILKTGFVLKVWI